MAINCHIHWLARACRRILVTEIRFIGFSILALLRIIGSIKPRLLKEPTITVAKKTKTLI